MGVLEAVGHLNGNTWWKSAPNKLRIVVMIHFGSHPRQPSLSSPRKTLHTKLAKEKKGKNVRKRSLMKAMGITDAKSAKLQHLISTTELFLKLWLLIILEDNFQHFSVLKESKFWI